MSISGFGAAFGSILGAVKVIRLTVLLVFGLLLAAVGALAACQRSLMYFPTHAQVAPTLPGVSVEHVRTEDGETLIAWYHAPTRAGQPILLFFDGNGGRPEGWDERWTRIGDHGAGFLALYYRGYSGSTGHPTEAGIHIDARAGYDWLIAHGYKPSDIVIHGFSLGAGPAVRLAMERPARALVLEGPYTGVDDVARVHFSVLASLVWDRFPTRDWIGQVHMPVLIVHGDRDNVVPLAQGERLYALANDPKEFVRVPGGGHVNLVYDGFYESVWAFLDRHPPADDPHG